MKSPSKCSYPLEILVFNVLLEKAELLGGLQELLVRIEQFAIVEDYRRSVQVAAEKVLNSKREHQK